MKAVDTNILARFILRDDARQTKQAETILGKPVWLSATVLLELGWVLSRRLKMDRAIVADALATLLELDAIHTGDRATLLWAIERFRAGADWADMIHLVTTKENAASFVTFDKELNRTAGPTSPLPIETLA